jgi:hypothetical protein
MHLDEERIERLLHDELGAPEAGVARAHVAQCVECRARLAETRDNERWAIERLRTLDHPVAARARPDLVPTPARFERPWRRWAAGIGLLVGLTGGAYAAVYLAEHVGRDRRPDSAQSASVDTVTQGVGVLPGERLTIVFATARPDRTVTIALTAGEEVMVRAVNGAATFSSEPERLAVDNTGSVARFEIDIPSTARQVEVRVGSRTVFTKRLAEVSAPTGRRDPRGRYVIPLQPGA